jgi:hypothetical protein
MTGRYFRRFLLAAPFFALMLSGCNEPKAPLYTSEQYVLTADSVVQGAISAKAVSSTEIHSSYFNHPRDILFKLSLNGGDYEQGYGIDHKVLLYPEKGVAEVPSISFGKQLTALKPDTLKGDFLEPNTNVVFTVDMRPVLEGISKKGYFETWNGAKIRKIETLALVGNRPPLDWDFGLAHTKPGRALTDPDGDGLYTATLPFNTLELANGRRVWKQTRDINKYPVYQSGIPVLDAVYTLSLDELEQNKTADGFFDTGAMWQGVWTRDVSYSILLSLAYLEPEIAKSCLRVKVKNGKIVQDTGTGGSWPVSSDRMIWVAAAMEIYRVTGDEAWLKEIYPVVRNSMEADLKALYAENGLVRGETSFADWREQSYPSWMQPVDIFASEATDNTAIHIYALRSLAEMAARLGDDPARYRAQADQLLERLNSAMWSESDGRFAAYRHSPAWYQGASYAQDTPHFMALAQTLPVLFELTTAQQNRHIAEKTPLTPWGIPTLFPQIPEIPAYHNNSVWPFVQALWTWAMAKEGETQHVQAGLGALYRGALLFQTNKENLRADNGNDYKTEINSDRQLWSVAGQLGMVYRVFFGMRFEADSLHFAPVVPPSFEAEHRITGFRYRNAVLDIEVSGHGNNIASFTLDGEKTAAAIPATLVGKHTVHITLKEGRSGATPLIQAQGFRLQTPRITLKNNTLEWESVQGADHYLVYLNGKPYQAVEETSVALDKPDLLAVWQVQAAKDGAFPSFLSNPVETVRNTFVFHLDARGDASSKIRSSGYEGWRYSETSRSLNTTLHFKAGTLPPGRYRVDVRYANGNGPVNTDNKCAVRTLYVNDSETGAVVLPQRGKDEWSNWGYSNPYFVMLKGRENFRLVLETWNENMNVDVNSALIDGIRLTRIE